MSSTKQIKQHFCYLVSSHQYRSAEGHPPNAPSILMMRHFAKQKWLQANIGCKTSHVQEKECDCSHQIHCINMLKLPKGYLHKDCHSQKIKQKFINVMIKEVSTLIV